MSRTFSRRLHAGLGRLLGARYYRWNIERELAQSGGAPMLVWQMGKVGSSTVYASMREARPQAPLFHIHMLTDEMLRKGELYQKSIKKGNQAFEYNICLREAMLASMQAGTRWKIVSVVREPVGRNLSAFFQNLELYFPYAQVRGSAVGKIPVDTLIETFLERFDHERPMQWFDGEIKGLLGVDVFAESFPREQGYCIYQRENFDLLLLRMEDIDNVAAGALADFLELPDFELVNRNVGSEKDYAATYRSVKKQIVFPAPYLDRCYASKYARHFYTDQELAGFRRRWERD